MKILVPKQNDWDEILNLYFSSFKNIYPAFLNPDFSLSHNNKPFCWIAVEKNSVVGFISIVLKKDSTDEWILRTIFVSPEHRRNGIASSLLCHAENFIRKNSGKKIILGPFANPYFTLGVPVSSEELNFFKKRGYSEFSYQPVWMNIKLTDWSPPLRYIETMEKLRKENTIVKITNASDRIAILKMTEKEFPNWHETWFKRNEEQNSPAPSIVAIKNGKAAGFTGPLNVENNEFGTLGCVGVSSTFRRKGIALCTVVGACEWWRKNGAKHGYLWTAIGNPALKLYKEVGFHVVETYAMMCKNL